MSAARIFNSSEFLQPTDGEPIRSVVTASLDTVVVAWYVKPGQEIPAHTHPHGQDTWTVLTGAGNYCRTYALTNYRECGDSRLVLSPPEIRYAYRRQSRHY